ncbi:TM0106 family RecB-like putative nuclease [Skermania sp. ID1734]|uniref:TM0106 family RecB-like putative nuclease n=1 Tax=Skermania sp. ID1734 TaxID=2597516 RepID=UPI00351B9191
MTSSAAVPSGPTGVGPVEARAGSGRVFIDARTLTGCRHRFHLDCIDPIPDAETNPGVRQRREAAASFREQVRLALTAADPDWVQIDADGDSAERVAATMLACRNGAQKIWGGLLPIEENSGRRGGAEILLRDAAGGYRPVIVVNHKVTDPRMSDDVTAAVTSDVTRWDPQPDPGRKIRPQLRDQLRLAHIYRMLQAHGLASPSLQGGVIGYGFDCMLVHDVAQVLDEYDGRFDDLQAIARGDLDTAPSLISECRVCPWATRCRAELAVARDVSLVASGSRADVLRAAGITTIDELAAWRADAPEGWQYGDFRDVVVTATAWQRDVPLVRRVPHVSVTRADVEVDVDLESYQEHGAYLWGTLLDGQYRAFLTWQPLPTTDEGRAFGEFWTWLMRTRADALAAGKTFAAYCYSRSAEDKWLLESAQRFAGMAGVPSIEEVREFIDGPHWVDIYQAVSDQFICPNGKGLKRVAPVAGFSWRDPEASGEASMGWYREAVGYDGEPKLDQRSRILTYNEDDVLATMTLREWMTVAANDQIPTAAELLAD